MSINSLKDPEILDLRVRRTQKLLWEALIALLEHQDFEAISVKDICDRAMIHRTTFYKHYEDKYDLLLKGMSEIYAALVAGSGYSIDLMSAEEAPPIFIEFFTHVEKNRHFYHAMLCGDGVSKVQSLLRTHLVELCESQLHKAARRHATPIVPIPLLAQFCAGTLISTTTWWLENDLPCSARQMACYVNRLLQHGCVFD